MVFRKLYKGLVGQLARSKDEEAPYCPVIMCETLRQLADPRKANEVRAWIQDDILSFIGPGKAIEFTDFPFPERGYIQVNAMIMNKMVSLEANVGVEFMWAILAPGNNQPYGTLPESTGMTVGGIARWCWIALEPAHGLRCELPECEFCGGETAACMSLVNQAYHKASFGSFIPGRIEVPSFRSFSEQQRGAYSIGVSLVTLRIMAIQLGMVNEADKLYEILESWTPILAKAFDG